MYFLYQKHFLLSRCTTQSYINDKSPTHTTKPFTDDLVSYTSISSSGILIRNMLQLDIPHIHSITSHNHTSHSCSKHLWNRIKHTLFPKCETGKLIKFSTLTLSEYNIYKVQ